MMEGFIFYKSFIDAMEDLTDEQVGRITRIIANYALIGEEPDNLDAVTKMAFRLIKPQIDANAKRREDGSKGGRPSKKPMVSENGENQKPMVSENGEIEKPKEKEKEKVKDKENDKELEKESPNGDKKESKHKHGSADNVLLTDNEFNLLVNDYGEVETVEAIEFLSNYIVEKGYKARDHNRVLRRWVFDAVKEKKLKQAELEQRENKLRLSPVTDWSRPIDWSKV